MPIRRQKRNRRPMRKFKRKYKRRLFRKSGTVQALKTTVCPDRLIVSLPYIESLARAPGVGVDDYIFNINSLFDPDRTGTGHQPLGYDQWAVFFNRYRVISCYADITVKNNLATSAMMFGLLPNNSSTTITGYGALEQSHVKMAMIGGSNGRDTIRIRKRIYLPRITGRTASQYMADDKYEGLFAANPSEIICLHCTSYTNDGTALDYDMTVRLIFTSELFDRLVVNIS